MVEVNDELEVRNISARFLVCENDIIRAGSLLYDVYIQELNWNFSHQTPFNIRVETLHDGTKILTDNCDPASKWIGAFENKQMIGCLRYTPRVGNKQLLQSQYYINPDSELNILLDSQPNIVEASRAAVIKENRGTGSILLVMFKFLFEYAVREKKSVFFTVSLPKLVKFFNELAIPSFPSLRFKYEHQDPYEVIPFLATYENGDIANALKIIDTLL